MRFKFLFILILCNYIFGQSLLNRAVGGDNSFGSARSYGMGFTHTINTNNSSMIRYNPSLLSYVAKNQLFIYDFQLNGYLIKERRSILVKDYFGDFLTYADYLNNENIYNDFQGGMIINLKNTFAISGAILPLATFDYDYIEEIRGSADVEDGDVGMKDPLVGYQIFNTSGKLNSLSLGASYSYNINNIHYYNIGFGYHKILNTEITDNIYIDSLTTQIENLSEVENYFNRESFNDLGGYYSSGFSYFNNEFLFSLNFESDILIQKELICGYQTFNFIDSTGTISYLDSSNANFIFSGLNYYKPQKLNIGISYNPKENSDLTVSAEYEINKVNNLEYLKDYNIYKLGFEYILPSLTPIRGGLVYKTSPINLIPDQSIITCGTGGSFNNIFYDIGLSYSLFDYYYPDLFPIEDTIHNGFDKITESKLSILFTLRYLFR